MRASIKYTLFFLCLNDARLLQPKVRARVKNLYACSVASLGQGRNYGQEGKDNLCLACYQATQKLEQHTERKTETERETDRERERQRERDRDRDRTLENEICICL